MIATAIEIELSTPLRITNLANLRPGGASELGFPRRTANSTVSKEGYPTNGVFGKVWLAWNMAEGLPTGRGALRRWQSRPVYRHRDTHLLVTAQPTGQGTAPQHRAVGSGRSTAIAPRICWNRSREIMTLVS